MATRVLHFALTPGEYDEFLAWMATTGDIHFLPACSDTDPPRTFRDPSAVRDARGLEYGAYCLVWNAAISPPPETRRSPAADNSFGRDLYFVREMTSEIATVGGPRGRLYTSDLHAPAYSEWYARLVRRIQRRCRYDRATRTWTSAALADSR